MHSSTQGQPKNYQHKPFPLLRNATKKGSQLPPKKCMFIKLPFNKFKWIDVKK